MGTPEASASARPHKRWLRATVSLAIVAYAGLVARHTERWAIRTIQAAERRIRAHA